MLGRTSEKWIKTFCFSLYDFTHFNKVWSNLSQISGSSNSKMKTASWNHTRKPGTWWVVTWSSRLWSCLQKSMPYFSAGLQIETSAFCYFWPNVIANSHRRIYFWSIVVYAVMQIVSRQLTKHACGLRGIPLWGRQWKKVNPLNVIHYGWLWSEVKNRIQLFIECSIQIHYFSSKTNVLSNLVYLVTRTLA